MEVQVRNIRRQPQYERQWLADIEIVGDFGSVGIDNARLGITNRGRYALRLPKAVNLPDSLYGEVRRAVIEAIFGMVQE